MHIYHTGKRNRWNMEEEGGLRMDSMAPRDASVVVTIDVPEALETSSLLVRLLETLRQNDTCALWSFEFSRLPGFVDQITSRSTRQEFGVLATPKWAGLNATRSCFGRELSARMSLASEVG